MVRAEKAEMVRSLKGTMTEKEAAEEANVSLSTVRKLWGTTAPAPVLEDPKIPEDDLGDTAFIMSEYRRVIRGMRAQYAYYEQREQDNPDNCAWGNLKLKAAQTELKALNDMKEAVGLGKIVYAGEDGFGYTETMITRYIGTTKPPVIQEIEAEEREFREANGGLFDLDDYDLLL